METRELEDAYATSQPNAQLGLCAGVFLLLAVLSCSPEAPRKDILGTETKLYSQFEEELIIRDFFQDRRGGVFLDVGSGKPIKNSTTYYLEKHLGWTGIAIDALDRYTEPYATDRPSTRFFSYIVTDHDGALEKFYRVKGAAGLSSTEEGRVFRGMKLRQEEMLVPTITLDVLLAREKVEKIDFLSMDIEGGTLKALAAFDIVKYKPEFVCIEHGEEYDQVSPPILLKWFDERGYDRIPGYDERDLYNWYFVLRD
jgi:FkbM family methyltransferase